VDHLIHTLMEEFLPDLEIRHERQTLGFEGPNLAEKRRRQILTRAPETPLRKIQKIDDLHFEVQSSNTNQSYHVDLNSIACNCKDFPRIRLCKHIAAVAHFFGGVDLGPRPPDNASASESAMPNSPVQQDGSAGSTNDDATASLISAANNMIRVTQGLISNTPRDPHIAKSITKSLNSMLSQIDALMHSATAAGDGPPLPEKEKIGPNQLSWPETTARMGVQRGKKRQGGKVDSALTAEHIGEPNRKRATDNDPYGAGEQSGKRAKPDARSAAANTRARAAEMRKAEPLPTIINTGTPVDVRNDALQTPLVLASQPPSWIPSTHPPPTPLPLLASLPLSAPPLSALPTHASLPLSAPPLSAPPPHASFPPYTYNPYHFHPPPVLLSQPMYSHSQFYPPYSPFSTHSQHSHMM
jgi:hypothetical protein